MRKRIVDLIEKDFFTLSKEKDKKEFDIYQDTLAKKEKYKVNIIALGDVGTNTLLGLKLLGGDFIEEIGIFDIDKNQMNRLEIELNQINSLNYSTFPKVKTLDEKTLFDCDLFVFCASAYVPRVDDVVDDVRMAQYKKNKELVEMYGKKATEKNFEGIFAVLSDPVDPLCNALVELGMDYKKVKGFGLGVMHARAVYISEESKEYKEYQEHGRVFGPHGTDLVVCNNVLDYDDEKSKRLSKIVSSVNLKVRKLGFKPFIAPAISSGAISLIDYLAGRWHYSNIYFGEAFLGIKNRRWNGKNQIENLDIPTCLYQRIENAIENLRKLR